MMSWRQLEEMSQFKGTIANHSITHPHLTERLKKENSNFYATYTLRLQSIINEILSNIGPELFQTLRQLSVYVMFSLNTSM